MTTLTTPPLLKDENVEQQSRKKQLYQAPTLSILGNTHIDGSIYELQEADAGNGNGAGQYLIINTGTRI